MFTFKRALYALRGALFPLLLLLANNDRASVADEVTIRRAESWTNVFASRPFTLNFLVDSQGSTDGHAAWRMSIGDRTVSRGQVKIQESAGPTISIPITLTAPSVKPGVILASKVEFGVMIDGKTLSAPAADLWVFPEDAFADRTEFLRSLELSLYDPLGKTVELFSNTGIPFQRLLNLDAAEEMVSGPLLVGEGINWLEHPSLSQLVWKLAANKTPVVCFAPASARLDWIDDRQQNLPKPMRQAFRSADAITSLDARLDGVSWQGVASPSLCTWCPEVDRGQLVLRANSDSDGWIWFEADFHPTGHRLLLCGMGIVEQWDISPTPRYLLLRLLESLAPNHGVGDD